MNKDDYIKKLELFICEYSGLINEWVKEWNWNISRITLSKHIKNKLDYWIKEYDTYHGVNNGK